MAHRVVFDLSLTEHQAAVKIQVSCHAVLLEELIQYSIFIEK
jgi:hypothetical protein